MRKFSPLYWGRQTWDFWCFFTFVLNSSMWILLRLRYVRRPRDPKKLRNSRSGTLSAQILYLLDKLDPGVSELLLLFVLDLASYLLVTLFLLD
jgi:hypothetical protein